LAREKPINAEVPAGGKEGQQAAKPAKGRTRPKLPRPSRPRPRVPLPLKLVGGAILLAAVFLVAAILGGGNGRNSVDGAAPLVGGDTTQPDRATGTEESTEELGYPGFATKNTTRIGGGDPAANAAGAALAVFPATDEAQRPAAVTLVDEADPEAAIAAAVLMAAPVRAPVLVAGEDGMPAVSAEALAALDPGGSSSTGGASVFAIGDVPTRAGYATRRVKAEEGAASAAAIAKLRDRLVGSPPNHIVIAPLGAPAFAMPAAAWAARSGDPVLYAGPKKLPKATARALRSHPQVPAYVLGPSSAISSNVLREIAAISPQVRRVAGEDPVANAIALARYDDGSFGWNVNDPGHGFVVARSDEPLDAAAASPLSAAGTWGPLLLTDDAGTLPAALRGYLLDVKPGYTEDPTRAFYNHVWVIGDQEAIEVGQQAEIDALAELAKIGGRR
jgi:Cell wall binding domain 2 (CWB2)